MRYSVRVALFFYTFFGAIGPILSQADDPIPEKLIVYTPSQALYVHYDEKGEVVGPMALKTRQFLDQTGLNYEIIIAPWQRAYTATLTRNNVGVVNIDRMPSREDLFHWIVPVNTRNNVLLARNEEPYIAMSKEAAVASDGLAVCVKNSSQCDMLRTIGFREDRIWQVSTENFEVVDLLLSGRADFFIYDFDNLVLEAELNQRDVSQITSLFQVNEMTAYFAVSKAIHPKILDKLQSAALRLMEPQVDQNNK